MTVNADCKTCAWETENGPLDTALSHKAAAELVKCNEASIRRHRNKHSTRITAQPHTDVEGSADVGADGGEFKNIKSDKPITNWDHVFDQFKLDPNAFTIINDTVRMSTWQQSKALENGTRDIVQLYSYRAQFARKQANSVNIDEEIANIRRWEPKRAFISKTLGAPVTFREGWADWQLGKGEGDGTNGTVQRVLDGFEKTVKRVNDLRRMGVNINNMLIANMGDMMEAVTGHYTSQTATTDRNTREQLKLAVTLSITGIRAYAPMFEQIDHTFCLCNHGQWQRLGGKQITDDSDNSTGAIADILDQVISAPGTLNNVTVHVPTDEMITTFTASGVNVAMSHGHKVTGSEDSWLAKQSAWLHRERGFRVDLYSLAHMHSAALHDYGPYTAIRDTTVDPGSKSFTDATGKYATQGKTTYVISDTYARKFAHYEVL